MGGPQVRVLALINQSSSKGVRTHGILVLSSSPSSNVQTLSNGDPNTQAHSLMATQEGDKRRGRKKKIRDGEIKLTPL